MRISRVAGKTQAPRIRLVKYVSTLSPLLSIANLSVGGKYDAQIHHIKGTSRKINTQVSSILKAFSHIAYMLNMDRWELGCRRLTPGKPYLDAIQRDNVSVVTSPIQRIVEQGIETADGQIHHIDAIVCATGFDTSFIPAFAMYGLDNRNLQLLWAEQHAAAYMGLAVSGFPNYWSKPGPFQNSFKLTYTHVLFSISGP